MSRLNKSKTPATPADVRANTAVFSVEPGRSKVYNVGRPLPALARVLENLETGVKGDDLNAGTEVEVVQVEIVDDKDIIVGFRHGKEKGVCELKQIEFL